MRITCSRESLAYGLGAVSRVAVRHTSMLATFRALTSYVLLEARDGLKLSATNLKLGITVQVAGVTVNEPGAVTVPAHLLTDLVKSLPGEEITLESHNGTLNVACGHFDTHIKGMGAEEFPLLEVEGQQVVHLPPDELRDAVQRVVIAAAKDETRPILTGVLARFEGEALTLAAADGFRLAEDQVPLPEPVSEPLEVVIPAPALVELSRLLTRQSEPVQMAVSEGGTRVLFRLTGVCLATQVVEGRFPDYRQVIPQSHTSRVVCDREELLKAARLGNLFVREASRGIRLIPDQDGGISLEAVSPELGDNVSRVEAVITGEPAELTLDAGYLVDVLSALEVPQVAIEMTTNNAPVVVRPVADEGYLYVVMPMQIQR